MNDYTFRRRGGIIHFADGKKTLCGFDCDGWDEVEFPDRRCGLKTVTCKTCRPIMEEKYGIPLVECESSSMQKISEFIVSEFDKTKSGVWHLGPGWNQGYTDGLAATISILAIHDGTILNMAVETGIRKMIDQTNDRAQATRGKITEIIKEADKLALGGNSKAGAEYENAVPGMQTELGFMANDIEALERAMELCQKMGRPVTSPENDETEGEYHRQAILEDGS